MENIVQVDLEVLILSIKICQKVRKIKIECGPSIGRVWIICNSMTKERSLRQPEDTD
jgi:hypothetical protein